MKRRDLQIATQLWFLPAIEMGDIASPPSEKWNARVFRAFHLL